MTAKEKKIILSDLELAMLKKEIRREFFPPDNTEEENKAFARVIDMAENLWQELDALDEVMAEPRADMMLWFWKKYCQQEGLPFDSYK